MGGYEKKMRPRMRWLPHWHALKVLAFSLTGRAAPIPAAVSEWQTNALERCFFKIQSPDPETVSYLHGGAAQGRPVIFVHGTPGSAEAWGAYLIDIPSGRRHIALDRCGYGRSSPSPEADSLKHQARAVAPLLHTNNGKRAIVVGHSFGAAVAVQAALDHPHLIGGLLLLAGAMDPDLEEAVWLQRAVTCKPISRLLPPMIDTANRELLGLKRELVLQADHLHRIAVPVGVVHGDRDPLVPPANADYLQRKLVNAAVETDVLRNKDHFIPWHSKPAIDRALERLVARVRKNGQ